MNLQIIAPTPDCDPMAFIDLSHEASQMQPQPGKCWTNTCENNSTCGCKCDNGV